MAHLWLRESRDDDGPAGEAGDWTYLVLAGETEVGSSAHLIRSTTPDGERWVVLGSRALRRNGIPVDAGITVLRDHDELYADGRRMFFSSESLAVIEPFPGGAQPMLCQRCRLEITVGSPSVACPQCGIRHHQSDESPCWTYADHCTSCDQPTALDAGFRWTPEHL